MRAFGILVFCLAGASAVALAQSNMPDVDSMSVQQLTDLLDRPRSNRPEYAVALAEAINARVARDGLDALALRACSYHAFAYYLSSQPREALRVANDCHARELQGSPSEVVGLESLRAGMMLAAGRNAEALDLYHQLLDGEFGSSDTIDPIIFSRVRINYATGLFTAGRIIEAIEQMQDVIDEAQRKGDATTTIGAANNLIVSLIEQKLYQDARAWIERVEPELQQLEASGDYPALALSVRLHALQLEGVLGYQEETIPKLREFIETYQNSSPINARNAWEYLAGALLKTGRLEEARDAAKTAVKYLSVSEIEQAEAKMMLAETELALGNVDAADALLRDAAQAKQLTDLRQERLLQLEINSDLRRADDTETLAKFEALIRKQDERERRAVEQNARYFDAKREAREQEREVTRLNQSREILAAQAAASEAEASAAAARAESAERQRLFVLIIAGLVAVGGVLVIMTIIRRRFDRRLRMRQRELNKQLTEQVEEQTRALKEQMEAKAGLELALADKARTEALGKLTGNVAHDFNNLLQVVSISNENMRDAELSAFQTSLLQGADKALSAAKSIVRQLLAYARRQSLEAETINVSDYLSEVSTLLNAAVDGRISFDLSDTTAVDTALMLDRSQLTTALLNLLRNSVDAMPIGGTITLQVDERNTDDKRWVDFVVTDDGVGMTEEQVAQACEPFFTTKEADSGTGLGLSSVHGFVSQSGGAIDISSVPDSGTVVTLSFPQTTAKAPVRTAPTLRRQGLKGLQILLVEDNAILAQALESMIVHLGAEVSHVDSGEAAIRQLEQPHDYDLVISDVRMPGRVNGFGLFDWIHEQALDLPILLMSGYTEPVSGDYKIMTKPFTQDDLLENAQQLVFGQVA
ncbi:MAG: ATP-binding protein [Pseudomonadota bacterium]